MLSPRPSPADRSVSGDYLVRVGLGLRVEWGFWSLGCAMFRVGLELNLQFIRLVAAEAGLQQVLIFKPFVLLAMGPLGNMRIACCRLFPFRIELRRCVVP